MFLELWKRREAIIAWEWGLADFEDIEQTRPEFETKVKSTWKALSVCMYNMYRWPNTHINMQEKLHNMQGK